MATLEIQLTRYPTAIASAYIQHAALTLTYPCVSFSREMSAKVTSPALRIKSLISCWCWRDRVKSPERHRERGEEGEAEYFWFV